MVRIHSTESIRIPGQRSSSRVSRDLIRGMERRRWTTGRYSSTGNDCLSDGVTQEGRQAGDWLFLYKRVGWVVGKSATCESEA